MSPSRRVGERSIPGSDLWAFGAVLFEMLTGRRAFGGEDVSLTMSAVLQREPDWTALPADLAPRLRTVLDRCLQKDPRQRLQARRRCPPGPGGGVRHAGRRRDRPCRTRHRTRRELDRDGHSHRRRRGSRGRRCAVARAE